MKKAVFTLVFFFYAMLSIGVNVKVHYCGKKIAAISVYTTLENKCCCAKKKLAKPCCKTDSHYVQLKSDVVKKESSIKLLAPLAFLPAQYNAPIAHIAFQLCSSLHPFSVLTPNIKQYRIALNVFRI